MVAATSASALLGLVEAIGAIVVGFVVAAVVARTKAQEATANVWKENAAAETARADRLHAQCEQLRLDLRAALEQNKWLKDQAFGTTAVRNLGEHLDAQHKELMGGLRDMRMAVDRLSAIVNGGWTIGG